MRLTPTSPSTRDILDAYDREMRRAVQPPGMRRETLPNLVRLVDLNGQEGNIIFSSMAAEDVDQTIQDQIQYFEGLGQDFEWKVFDHDQPPDLKDRLIASGFKLEDSEALLVLEISRASKLLLQPPEHDVRLISPDTVGDFKTVLFSVWGDRTFGLAERLLASMRTLPASVSIYVAYDDGRPVSCGWTSFDAGPHFAGLWSGSTLTDYRGRGFYTAIVAARVQEARRRGLRFAAVDAKPTSRPILQKLGFQIAGWSHELKWSIQHPGGAD